MIFGRMLALSLRLTKQDRFASNNNYNVVVESAAKPSLEPIAHFDLIAIGELPIATNQQR